MAKLLQKTELLRWSVRESWNWGTSISFICRSSSKGGSSSCSSGGSSDCSSTGSDRSSPNVWFQLRPSPPAASRGWPCPTACSGRMGSARVPAGRRRPPRHPTRPKGRKPVSEHFIHGMNKRFDSTDKFTRLNLRRISFRFCSEEVARWRSESVARLFRLTWSSAFILVHQGQASHRSGKCQNRVLLSLFLMIFSSSFLQLSYRWEILIDKVKVSVSVHCNRSIFVVF